MLMATGTAAQASYYMPDRPLDRLARPVVCAAAEGHAEMGWEKHSSTVRRPLLPM